MSNMNQTVNQRVSTVLACALTLCSLNARAATETVLHSFNDNGTDGFYPESNLINIKGNLYGTTSNGGECCQGNGTVFSVNLTSGAENTLHSFDDGSGDGVVPTDTLIDVKNILYGTTVFGGSHDAGDSGGTVFSLDRKTGVETVLYSFCSAKKCADGSLPQNALLELNGILYGVTASGGSLKGCSGQGGCGTVFSVDPKTGKETVIHSFQANGTDGYYPNAALVNVNGTLYGTTWLGGGSGCQHNGCGTIFSVDPKTGAETVVYSFAVKGRVPSAEPSNLLNVKGMLYGETGAGGDVGVGAIFSFDPSSNTQTTLYSFMGNNDGESPRGGVTDVNNILYGVTATGGGPNQSGTVFSYDLGSATEAVLYSFCSQTNCSDGAFPGYGVTDVNGTLYGVTYFGGANNYGTVFAVTP
jgi:uncharacterized repeat protein (TIGR03803 family)